MTGFPPPPATPACACTPADDAAIERLAERVAEALKLRICRPQCRAAVEEIVQSIARTEDALDEIEGATLRIRLAASRLGDSA